VLCYRSTPRAPQAGIAELAVMATAPSAPFDERAMYEREQREEAERAARQQGQAPGAVPPPAAASPMHHELPHEKAHTAPPPTGAPPPQQHSPQYTQAPPQQQAYHQAPHYAGPQPLPGIPIRPPLQTPPAGYVITGYQVVQPTESCSCDLKLEGWLVVIILLFFFPCVACIPCCLPECFQSHQVPIYGPPGSTPPSIPIATPVY